MVTDAATFSKVYFRMDAVFKDKRVLIYNYAFDITFLNYCCRLHTFSVLKLTKRSDCLMEWVAQWTGNLSCYPVSELPN